MTSALETVKTAVSSLVTPAVLLAAALIVALGGSGADALSSLDQLTKGPDVPPTPVNMVSRDAPVGADVAHLDGRLVASAGAPAAQAQSPVRAASTPQGGGSAASPTAATGAGSSTPSSTSGAPSASTGQGGAGPGSATTAPAPSAPPSSNPAPAPSQPNPVGDVLDQTEQLANDLLKPVTRITNPVLGGLPR